MKGVVEVLPLETWKNLSVSIKSLKRDSDEYVCVRCVRCGEVFLRHYKSIYLLHDCPDTHSMTIDIPVRTECVKLKEDAKLPSRKRASDAGHDIYAIEDSVVPARGRVNVKTGLALSVPEGWYYTVDGRSGLWIHEGIGVFRGIIDSTYTGELKATLQNHTDNDYYVKKYDRVAQIILHKSYVFDITVVEEFSKDYSTRGKSGFGSSGR